MTRSADAFSHRDFQWELIDDLVPGFSHDERVVEEDAEQAVGRDRVGLGHDHHAGLEHFLEGFRLYVLAVTWGLSVTRSMRRPRKAIRSSVVIAPKAG